MTARKRDVDATIDRNDRPGRAEGDDGAGRAGGKEGLRRVLDAGGIQACYRPVVRTDDRSAVGLEMVPGRDGSGDASVGARRLALRAARAGLATRLDERSLGLVRRDLRRGALPGWARWVAVGLSSRSFHVPQVLGRALSLSSDLGRKELDLVVVLSAKDPDLDLAEAALGLSRLRSSGVRVALDHLGEGRFPLSRLSDYPLDLVKMTGRAPGGEGSVDDLVGYIRALIRVVRAAGPRVVLALEPGGGSLAHAHVLEEADYAVGGKFGPAVPLPHPA